MYKIVAEHLRLWGQRHPIVFNNQIIDLLRNRLARDFQDWYEIYINKTKPIVPKKYRCVRTIQADLSHRKFKYGLTADPCEICGHDRAKQFAHIIPKACGGSDDDWNLVYLCANHHYLFDRNLLTLEEWRKIHWDTKGSEARYYADKVRLISHQKYWRKATRKQS
jgi:hypothetical protein